MHSVPRKLALGLILAAGVAACGDDVTVPPAVTPTPTVRGVVVSPSSAIIQAGGTFQFGAAVDADAGIANTVTWTASGGTGITVSQDGLATASATASGTASICAASTASAAVRGCAQLAVSPAAPPATVQIDAITVGCTPLNTANPGFTGCGFLVPVAVNNVYGQIDIRGTVNRQNSSDVKAVRIEIFGTDAAGNAVGAAEYTNKETLLTDVASTESIALQGVGFNSITHSVNTADYTLAPSNTAPTSAKVVHTNGQKKIRLTLLGVNDAPLGASSTSERTLSFRNANGFHVIVNTALNSGNNANSTCGATGTAACPVRVNALAGPTAGLAYNGGTPLNITAVAVVYATGALHPNGFTGTIVQSPGTGVGFGSAACDLLPGGLGGGQRILGNATVTIPAGTTGNTTGTLAYTNNAPTATSPAPAGTVTGYEMSPVCAASAVGELPFGVGADVSGNPLINFSLVGSGIYGIFNTLNSPFGPVNATLPTAPAIRLDNGGPAAIFGYATGRNNVGTSGSQFAPDACFGLWLNITQTNGFGNGCGAPPVALTVTTVPVNATPQAAFVFGRTARMNGWVNPAVEFNRLSATMVTAAALTAAVTVQSSEGAVAPSNNTTGLPLDAGVGNGVVGGNASTLIGRVGTFGPGGTCITIATCAALPAASIRATAAGLAETNTGFSLGVIIQSVDPFGNLTNPPAAGTAANPGGTNNFGVTACPAQILVFISAALCLPNPLDPINPYVVGGVLAIGFDATTPTIASRGGPAVPGGLSGLSLNGTTFTNNTIQGIPAADFDYQADDAVPVGLFGTSGILTTAPGSDLYVSLSRRDGATLQHFCPNGPNPNAGQYQPAANGCPTQFGWAANAASGITTTTIYNRGAGRIFTDPNNGLVRAYYAIIVFTRDQAGNQTTLAGTTGITAQIRDFIWDNTPPASFGASFSPGVLPAAGPVVFTGSGTEDLDVGRGAFSIGFVSLFPMVAPFLSASIVTPPAVATAQTQVFIRLPWANKNVTGQLTNPVGYLAAGPSMLATIPPFSQTWSRAIRSLEVVNPGDNTGGANNAQMCVVGPPNGGFVCNVATVGNVNFPGGLSGGGLAINFNQDGNLAAPLGASPTQMNWFTQSVSRVGLAASTGAPASIQAATGQNINYGQSGLLGSSHPCGGAAGAPNVQAFWSAVQAAGAVCNGINNQFFNMQWALRNPATDGNNNSVDLNGANLGNNGVTSRVYNAIAFGANGPMQQPFLGGVKFYALDIRQPLNVDANTTSSPPSATGAALVEICAATSIINDQATNSWQFSCTYNPGTGGDASILRTNDLGGFNFPNQVNLQVTWIAPTTALNWQANGVSNAAFNLGFWGNAMLSGAPALGQFGFNQGWQGHTAVAALVQGASNIMPVIAIGCTGNGQCLATRISNNLGFSVQP